MNWSFHLYSRNLGYKNNSKWKYKSCGKIRIHRTNIGSKPIIRRDKNEPIKYKSKYVSWKYYHHNSSKKPHISSCHLCTSEKWSCISKYSIYYIKTECSYTRKCLSSNSSIKNCYKNKKNCHKYPSRKYGVCYRKSSYCHPMDNFSFWAWNMRTSMFCSSMSSSLMCRSCSCFEMCCLGCFLHITPESIEKVIFFASFYEYKNIDSGSLQHENRVVNIIKKY